MIVCRRPVLIFDVDLIGATVCAALFGLGYLGGVQRVRADWESLGALRARAVAADRACQAVRARLSEAQRTAATLRAAIENRAAEVPGPEALSAFLSRVGVLAAESDLMVQQVAPQPMQVEGAYVVCEIRMSGSGRSLDFIRFLDRLARDSSYHVVRGFRITGAGGQEPNCALSWTLRLYMLPSPERSAAARPAGSSPVPPVSGFDRVAMEQR